MKDTIFIVAFKKVEKPLIKDGYQYIQACAEKVGNLGCKYADNVGENNISIRNNNFCELTAMYWIWKNYKCLQTNIVGINHYRRFFSKIKTNRIEKCLNINEAKEILNEYDMIVPKKFKFSVSTRRFFSEYGSGKDKDLENTRNIIKEKYPDYVKFFDEFCNEKEGYYCNMMICKKKDFDIYCSWLFDILFSLDKMTDLSNYSPSESRIYGYISELLFNVYIKKNKLNVKELYLLNTDNKSIIVKSFLKIKNKLKSQK